MTSSASPSTPQSTISPSSSHITTTGMSASASSPTNLATPSSSSAASAGTSGSLACSILAAASLLLATLLWSRLFHGLSLLHEIHAPYGQSTPNAYYFCSADITYVRAFVCVSTWLL
jgi:hypothetical protein